MFQFVCTQDLFYVSEILTIQFACISWLQTLVGDFQKEQEKFIQEKHSKRSEAAVPPWVGYNEEKQMKEQILALSQVSLLNEHLWKQKRFLFWLSPTPSGLPVVELVHNVFWGSSCSSTTGLFVERQKLYDVHWQNIHKLIHMGGSLL